MISVTRNR